MFFVALLAVCKRRGKDGEKYLPHDRKCEPRPNSTAWLFFFTPTCLSYANKLHKPRTTVRLSNVRIFVTVILLLQKRIHGFEMHVNRRRLRTCATVIDSIDRFWVQIEEGGNRGVMLYAFYLPFVTHNPSSANIMVLTRKKNIRRRQKKVVQRIGGRRTFRFYTIFSLKRFAYPLFYAENWFEFLLVFIR